MLERLVVRLPQSIGVDLLDGHCHHLPLGDHFVFTLLDDFNLLVKSGLHDLCVIDLLAA